MLWLITHFCFLGQIPSSAPVSLNPIMRSTIIMMIVGKGSTHGASLECQAAGLLILACLVSGPAPAVPDPTQDVTSFVSRIYAGGVPFDEARKLDSTAVPTLRTLLKDPKQERFWPNVVRTLGIIGDKVACLELIGLLERDVESEFSPALYRAKTGVIFSLAYVVERDRSATVALQYLIDSIDPAVWARKKPKGRGLKWKGSYHPTPEDRDRHLSKIAILALGLTGDPRAMEALEKPPTKGGRKFFEQAANVVLTAQNAHKIVAKDGLAAYYRSQGVKAYPKN